MTVSVQENIWIPLADGTRLAARLWLPEGAETAPAPAVLEYIPYRKRDGTRGRDEPMHGWFAAQGYAAIRVDMRGTGESDGHMADEYLKQEQDDALEVIAWIAAQPWCTGAVGMMGKSWGGFNALQVAARRPPALKAIITVYSTDHRYSDDIHYQGGCLLNDNLWWGAIMLAYQARPADPAIVGEGWRRQWLERLERMPFFPALWLRHQRYDEYWKHGSVCEDWSAIQVPVLAVGGWADSYTNAVPRLLAGLKVPRRGIIGPWGHVYPQDGAPGPAIGFLQEALRWWDQWLKGHDTGVMAEPMLRAFVEDWNAPAGSRAETEGRWVGEAEWPSPAIAPRRWALNAPGALADAAGPEVEILVRSPLSHGKAAGEWMATGCPGELPVDQRLDDGAAQLFDTAPLDEAVEILGAPELLFDLAADAPVAQLAVRLCDVAPDG
uniref:CocE/NonD family hydrolase n=1 Tax=Inquilinus sp. TaxID=1932117 RepID=UPI0031DB6FCE